MEKKQKAEQEQPRPAGRPPKDPTVHDLIVQLKAVNITADRCLKAYPRYKLRLTRTANNLRRDIDILNKIDNDTSED